MYNPAAKVAHYRPNGYAKFARMFKRYGAAQGYLVKKYGMFRLIHWIPVTLLAGLALVAGLSLWNPWFLLTPLVAAPFSFGWFLVTTRSPAKSIRFAGMLAILLVSWNMGFLYAYLRGEAPGST